MEKIMINIDGTQNFGNGDTNNVELTTTGELNVLADSYTVKYEEDHTFILVYNNGEWKFSKFYCIGF